MSWRNKVAKIGGWVARGANVATKATSGDVIGAAADVGEMLDPNNPDVTVDDLAKELATWRTFGRALGFGYEAGRVRPMPAQIDR